MAKQMGAAPSLHDAASLHDSYMRSTSPCATHTCLVCPNLGPGRHPKARPYRNPNPSSASYAPGRPYVAPRYPRYPALGRPVTGGTLPGLGGRESRLIPAATAAAPRRQTGDQREACAERFWRVSAILLSEGQLEFPAVSARAGRRAQQGIGPSREFRAQRRAAACWAHQGIPGPAGRKHKSSGR